MSLMINFHSNSLLGYNCFRKFPSSKFYVADPQRLCKFVTMLVQQFKGLIYASYRVEFYLVCRTLKYRPLLHWPNNQLFN